MMTGCNCLPDHDQNNYHQLPQTCLNADGIGIVMLGNSYNTISRQSPDSWSWVHSSVATNSLNIRIVGPSNFIVNQSPIPWILGFEILDWTLGLTMINLGS